MPDVVKDVVARMSVPKIQGAAELTDLAKKSRDAAEATEAIGKAVAPLSPGLRRMGQDGTQAFRNLGDSARRATGDVVKLNRELEQTKKHAGGGGLFGLDRRGTRALTHLTGTSGLYGVSRLATMGGGIGLAALAAHDVGGLGMNAMYNSKFGQGPLQKEDSGMVMSTLAGLADSITGRKFRERDMDRRMEGITTGAETAYGVRGKEERDAAEVAKLTRQMHYGTGLEAMEGFRDRSADVTMAMARQSGLANTHMKQFSKQGALWNWSTRQFQQGKQGLNTASQTSVAADMAGNAKLELEDRKRLKDLVVEQLSIEREKAAALRAGVQQKRSQFATMDPIQRMMAKELGGKLQRGEALTPEEMENAQGMPVLRDLVQKKREQDAEPDFVGFLKEAGNAEERGVAGRAQKMGIGVNAVLQFDEEAIVKTMRGVIEQAQMKIRNVEVRLDQAMAQQKNVKDRWEKEKGALIPQ